MFYNHVLYVHHHVNVVRGLQLDTRRVQSRMQVRTCTALYVYMHSTIIVPTLLAYYAVRRCTWSPSFLKSFFKSFFNIFFNHPKLENGKRI